MRFVISSMIKLSPTKVVRMYFKSPSCLKKMRQPMMNTPVLTKGATTLVTIAAVLDDFFTNAL